MKFTIQSIVCNHHTYYNYYGILLFNMMIMHVPFIQSLAPSATTLTLPVRITSNQCFLLVHYRQETDFLAWLFLKIRHQNKQKSNEDYLH